MPELPEVESVARILRVGHPPLVGRRVTSVNIVWSGCLSREFGSFDEADLLGALFTEVSRHGKYLLLQVETATHQRRHLIVHLRMTGRLVLVPADEAVERHTRLALLLDNGFALRFDDPRKFGRVWFVDDPAVVLKGLGPDALTVAGEDFVMRLSGCHRQIKPLLLDQGFVAGIGNIYADESLFQAGIHPLTNSSNLSRGDIFRLHSAVMTVLKEAVDANGANIDGVFKAGNFIVSVYGREGAPCRVCGTEISKIRVGQRGTHFCRECQKQPTSC